MSVRELVILGTSAQVPTRYRNHNGYFLRWDDEGFLFDPGEGTQRQLIFADVSSPSITQVCLTHFHGDHCLGLPGIVQRLSLDHPSHHIDLHYPAMGEEYLKSLLRSSSFQNRITMARHPIHVENSVYEKNDWTLVAHKLEHSVESWGYRLMERDSHTILANKCETLGIHGIQIGELKKKGFIDTEIHGRIHLEEVSEHRQGQTFAFIMDTRPCDAAYKLAEYADLVVFEATYAPEETKDAHAHFHMTMLQAAQIAKEASAKQLVLTHFSQRYGNVNAFLPQVQAIFPNTIMAKDLDRIPFPKRHRASEE